MQLLINLCAGLAALSHILGYNGASVILGPFIPLALLINSVVAARRADYLGLLYLVFSLGALGICGVTVYWIGGTRFTPQLYQPNPLWFVLNRAVILTVFTWGMFMSRIPLQGRIKRLEKYRFWPLYIPSAGLGLVLVSTELVPIMDMYVSAFSLFWGAILLSLFCLGSCFVECKKRAALMLVGTILFGVFHLPLAAALLSLQQGQRDYGAIFAQQWTPQPLSIPAYYLGLPHGESRIEAHGLFYADESLRLHYDAFYPPNPSTQLLPVIIRLHGGGWTGGNKGDANRVQLSKHLAHQGYAVYDVQYGLNHRLRVEPFVKAPAYLSGSYSIDDMVLHIGHFLSYLTDNHTQLGIDLNRIVLFGNSAGGQLAMAVGLAEAHGHFDKLVSQDITIRGLVACYPANGLSAALGIAGSPQLTWPEQLATPESPPLLLLHGTHDATVPLQTSLGIRQSYWERGNSSTMLLVFPLAGHSPDLHYSGFYNQVWLQFLDSFLELVFAPGP